MKLRQKVSDLSIATKAGIAFLALAAGLFLLWAIFDSADEWALNLAPEAAAIAATILIVERIVRREARERARPRVEQVLFRVRGDFYTLADFVLWDYSALHHEAYDRPPADFREILAHFEAGLEGVDQPWRRDLHLLVATKVLADRLAEQIGRHERVLEDDFIASAYRYMRAQRMSRNMYLDETEHHDDAAWRKTALRGLVRAVREMYEAYESYATAYLPEPSVTVSEEMLDSLETMRPRRQRER